MSEALTREPLTGRKEGPVVGVALGSGSARGWAHIGVLRELEAMGIRPHVVAGTSIGALVGGVYVSGRLDAFTDWVTGLSFRDVLGFLDVSFSGGFVKGEKLFSFFRQQHENPSIEDLEAYRFATVATDMQLGREVWIQEGTILDAARASCALPGLFSPVKYRGRWMLDGGLVNPVPVSVCRALGADLVIGVNLNGHLVGRHVDRRRAREEMAAVASERGTGEQKNLWEKVVEYFADEGESVAGERDDAPGFLDVIGASVNIMQDRITRSRMAGEPADVNLLPMLENYALMDFHRAGEAIQEGERLVRAERERIEWLYERLG